MESFTILVTGTSGFAGKSMIPHLLSHGFAVRGLVREGSSRSLQIHPNLTYVLGDMRDHRSLEEAVKGVDCVLHLAAAKSDEAESEAVNVGGARNLAEACKSGGVKLLINVSTQSAKLTHKGLYGRTKEEADTILHASGIPVVTLRCSVLYSDLRSGIFGSLMAFTRLPVIPVIGSGKAVFRPLHLNDLAEIIKRCIHSPAVVGRTFDVGGPDAVSLSGLVDEMLRRQKRRRMKLHIPVPIAMTLASLCSFLPHPPITRSNVLGAAPCTRSGVGADEQLVMHPEELWTLIGFVPRSLSSGLDTLFAEKREKECEEEARALLSYVMSGTGKRWSPSTVHVSRFLQASKKLETQSNHHLDPIIRHHSLLLGSLDAITRLCFPHCILQKKMLIAAAIVECSPESAEWLLPKERSIMTLALQIVGIALRSLLLLCIGIPLLAFPRFSKGISAK